MLAKYDRKHELFPTLRGLDDLFSAVWNRFDPFLPSESMIDGGGFAKLEVEVKENEVIARLPLPGFRSEDIDVQLENNVLTISARHEETSDGHKKKLIRQERVCESCEQSVTIPCAVSAGKASAKYTDGVLCITLPREKAAESTHVVKVN